MKKELEQKFYDRWPKWFEEKDWPSSESCMCWGFSHDDGWFDIEWCLCEDLEKLMTPEESEKYRVHQVKEKFGSLRWYDNSDYGAINERVNQACDETEVTCEVCGKEGTIGGRNWIKTLCKEHKRSEDVD